ncbi:LexA family transcriptional regulator [Helicobacter typhlonius]
MVEIGKKIAQIRSENGKTQQELADFLGVDVKKVGRIERGETKSVKDNDLRLIADFFNLPLSVLLESKMSVSPVSKLSVSDKHNVSMSNSIHQPSPPIVPQSKIAPNSAQPQSFYSIPVLSIKASAGRGNDIMELESYESGEVMCIDKGFFKSPPNAKVRIIQVDGYSMIPMLLPDSWVIFEESDVWRGDGLYVLNYDNELMVKLLQKLPNGNLEIISANKDYKSFVIERDTQSVVRIVGKVLRSIL